MSDLDWLTARPIAHRGLHDQSRGVIENTASAVAAALDLGYAIEVDLQISADGHAVVFHDETLNRLTEMSGDVAKLSASELKSVNLRGTDDRMQTLPELLDQVSGRAPIILELKSRWTSDTALARCAAEALQQYRGPIAVMSFDPVPIRWLRRHAPGIVRGIVACAFQDADEWQALSAGQRFGLRLFSHIAQTRPHFVSYDIKGLRSAVPRLLRALSVPLITWTVRTADEADFAAKWADQITFEGFLPEAG
jgi:glycerophosphoryl diester phosphodiesterase